MEDNELLKLKFQKLHTELVGQNLSSVVDRLFAAGVISAENMEDISQLTGGPGWSTDKSRRLMSLLHRSSHPAAFTELRAGLSSIESVRWIVDRLDQVGVEDRLMQNVDYSKWCQCPNCARPHHPAAEAEAPDKYDKKEVTMLFLGETGVGKSTLINALANYMHFSTLSDAEAYDGFFPVPVSFTVTDPVTYRRRTISTGPYDAQETDSGDGGSVTRSPTAYVLDLGVIRVNLIDTPGVKSTHGSSQDSINAHDVLTFVSAYEKIDLICIVVKPNETRLTQNFEDCLREILRNLHDSACNNVVFCVTFCKSSNYGPGDTYGILAAFCSKQPKLRDLELTRRTVYCFENEPVRYLAECVCKDDSRASVELSWLKSVETTERLWRVAVQITAHSVVDTLSLNNCRRAIHALCQPLVQTTKCVAVNVRELKRAKEKIAFSPSTSLTDGTVEILQRHYRLVELPHSATVCTSRDCCTISKGDIYERVCHDRCRWTPTIRMCRVFNVAGLCEHCGCSYRSHVWKTCVAEMTSETLVLKLSEIQHRKDQSITELATLIDTCAKLTAFLRDNSFLDTFGDVIAESLQTELDSLSDQHGDKLTPVICNGICDFQTSYKHSVELIVAQEYTPSDIHEMIEELFRLQLNGRELRAAVNIVRASTDVALKKRRKIFYFQSWMFRKQHTYLCDK